MAGNEHARAALDRFAPHSHGAMKNFVMAMAGVVNNAGKKSFFGKDKGLAAMERFMKAFQVLLITMATEGQLGESDTAEDVADRVDIFMKVFKDGYPNWQDAYLYYEWMTTENRERYLQMIESAA